MAGQLAVDFGTSNTVIAVWNEAQQDGVPLHIPDYGHIHQFGDEPFSVVPSLIHYVTDKQQWIGEQVLQRNLYESRQTFRWMKRYISHRNQHPSLQINGKTLSHYEAAKDFLSAVLGSALHEINVENAMNEEVALTVPVEAFEHYEDWLTGVAEAAGISRIRIIDEASAAALGYGAHIQPGDTYLIFDFGGGTLDVSVVLIKEEDRLQIGRYCRVLGKAGLTVGGANIDQWLFQEVLRQNGRYDYENTVKQLSRELLVECERVKEHLSTYEQAKLNVKHPDTGEIFFAEFTRSKFEALLDEHDLFRSISKTIKRALKNSYELHGYNEEHIKAILMVGGSSAIPCVQRIVGCVADNVMLNRPLDAVARGAAAFVAGVDFYDHIQHDYAIRHVNREKGRYDYRTIVSRGTSYPTTKSVDSFTIKAAYDGQTELGIAVFEISESQQRKNEPKRELVFDIDGAVTLGEITPDEEDRRTNFWMNEHKPLFLKVDYPVKQGEACYNIDFNINSNKQLLLTAFELKTGKIILQDYPVVKLT